jgi:hypothetical protein
VLLLVVVFLFFDIVTIIRPVAGVHQGENAILVEPLVNFTDNVPSYIRG